MKKLLVCIAVFLLLCASALAETVAIPLADGELTFKAFNGGYVLTEETSASVFNQVGLSQREIIPWMEEHNLYALMYDADLSCEVQIEVLPVSQPDYNTITPEQDAAMLKSFVEFNEQYGLDVSDYGMYDNGHHRFGWLVASETPEGGLRQNRIHYKTCHNDYMIEMIMFVSGETIPDSYCEMALSLVDSMHYTLNPNLVRLSCGNASIQLAVPEGMTVHASAEEAGITLAEPAAADVVGCMADPAGAWYMLWQLDESASGDMERLSAAGVRSLYEARAKKRRFLGCTVTLTESHPESRQVYVRMAYHFTDETGRTWYAEEYYTKQDGWGAIVTAYSGAPFTEEQLALLETIVDSQMVTVDE